MESSCDFVFCEHGGSCHSGNVLTFAHSDMLGSEPVKTNTSLSNINKREVPRIQEKQESMAVVLVIVIFMLW